jgi:hypothetical protein
MITASAEYVPRGKEHQLEFLGSFHPNFHLQQVDSVSSVTLSSVRIFMVQWRLTQSNFNNRGVFLHRVFLKELEGSVRIVIGCIDWAWLATKYVPTSISVCKATILNRNTEGSEM